MRQIDSNRIARRRTICEIHRELYRTLKADGVDEDSKAMTLLKEAYPIGKKLVAKLRQYKHGFDDGWYEKNKRGGPAISDPESV